MRHTVSLEGVHPAKGYPLSKIIYHGRQRGIAEAVRDNLSGAILDLGLPLAVEHYDGVDTVTLPIRRRNGNGSQAR